MILMEFTPDGGTLQRISTQDIALEYQWFSYINSLASIKFSTSKKYGGYVKPTFSNMKLSPDLFVGDLAGTKTATVKIIQTETDENGGIVLFDGTAQRYEYNRRTIGFNLHQPEFDDTILSGVAYSDTLVNIATTLATALGLLIDTSQARNPSPAVAYTTTADIQTIDLLDGMCAGFVHAFKIIEGTLYLFDLKATTTAIEMTEFDALPCSYRDDKPISLVTGGGESVEGSSPNGDEVDVGTVYHTTPANIVTILTDIKDILEKDVIVMNTKIDDDKPTLLDTFTYFDESMIDPLTTTAIAINAIYNYNTLDLRIEGVGVVA